MASGMARVRNGGSDTRVWRPWESSMCNRRGESLRCAVSTICPQATDTGGKNDFGFKHPVRLLWPRSKSFDYLYEDGQRLLACFPVQATIAFYESESEDEIEGETEELGMDGKLQDSSSYCEANNNCRSHGVMNTDKGSARTCGSRMQPSRV